MCTRTTSKSIESLDINARILNIVIVIDLLLDYIICS